MKPHIKAEYDNSTELSEMITDLLEGKPFVVGGFALADAMSVVLAQPNLSEKAIDEFMVMFSETVATLVRLRKKDVQH